MKRTIIFVAILLFGLILSSDVEGQRRNATKQTQSKVRQQQMRRNLDRLKGTRELTAQYSESGASLSNKNNGLSISFGSSNTTVTKFKQVIGEPSLYTITFDSDEYFFTLKFNATSQKYILSAKKGDSPIMETVGLVYSAKVGFVKAGPSKGGNTGFSPKITFDEGGGHTWFIKPDFKVTFTKLKEGETKNP